MVFSQTGLTIAANLVYDAQIEYINKLQSLRNSGELEYGLDHSGEYTTSLRVIYGAEHGPREAFFNDFDDNARKSKSKFSKIFIKTLNNYIAREDGIKDLIDEDQDVFSEEFKVLAKEKFHKESKVMNIDSLSLTETLVTLKVIEKDENCSIPKIMHGDDKSFYGLLNSDRFEDAKACVKLNLETTIELINELAGIITPTHDEM